MDPNRKRITELIAHLAAAYPNFKMTALTMAEYVDDLQDLDPATLQEAMIIARRSSEFFPTIARIRKSLAEVVKIKEGIPTSGEAWGEVQKKMAEIGSMEDFGGIAVEDLGLSHPLIGKVVRILGWRNLCKTSNMVADRARFIQIYDDLLESRYQGVQIGIQDESIPRLEAGPAADGIKKLVARMGGKGKDDNPQT